jgi:hypothetical protein
MVDGGKIYPYYLKCPHCDGVAFLIDHILLPGEIIKSEYFYLPSIKTNPVDGTVIRCDSCLGTIYTRQLNNTRVYSVETDKLAGFY